MSIENRKHTQKRSHPFRRYIATMKDKENDEFRIMKSMPVMSVMRIALWAGAGDKNARIGFRSAEASYLIRAQVRKYVCSFFRRFEL